jgi:hypothetical protein
MALEGSLKEFNLADILQLLFFQKKTGVLMLQGGTDRVRILFHEGNIVGADSRKRDTASRLGRMLVGQGIVTEENLKKTLEKQKQERVKLGALLVREGLATPEKIQELISFQITETLVQTFSWQEGRYEFKAQVIPVDRELPIVINTEHFLMEGLRFVDEWSQIGDRIGIDSIFVPNPAFEGEFTPEERKALSYVNGVNDVGAIADFTGIDSFTVSTTLLGLLDKGAIAEPGREEEAQEIVRRARPIPGLRYILAFLLLGAFAASTAWTLLYTKNSLKEFLASETLDRLRLTVETGRFRTGAYPASLAETDPWGNPYVYIPAGDSFDLLSAGPDGMRDTSDDLR